MAPGNHIGDMTMWQYDNWHCTSFHFSWPFWVSESTFLPIHAGKYIIDKPCVILIDSAHSKDFNKKNIILSGAFGIYYKELSLSVLSSLEKIFSPWADVGASRTRTGTRRLSTLRAPSPEKGLSVLKPATTYCGQCSICMTTGGKGGPLTPEPFFMPSLSLHQISLG